MPEATELETVTRKQRIWANLILVEGGFAPEPEEEEEPTEHSPEGTADRFGDGSKKTVLPYGTSIPQEFKEALKKGGDMLSANGWKNVLQGRTQFLKNLEDLAAKETELARVKEREQELEDPYLMDQLSQAEQDEYIDCGNTRTALDHEIKALKASTAQAGLERKLAILESPGNNPEYLEVSEKLEGFAQFEKEFAERKGDKEYVSKKAKHLYGLQAVVFKWIDRRTQQNLQPSADAIALADIIQRVHQEMMAVVIKNGDPMPFSEENEATLSVDEKANIQQTWKNLVESQHAIPAKGSQLSVKAPPADEYLRNDAAREQFQIETLANLSRLLQIPSGRQLIAAINQGDYPVKFAAGKVDGCGPAVEKDALEKDAKNRARGSSSTVYMVLGQKDSDNLLSTATGGVLFCPSFIAVGHELVHALHNSQGRNHRNLPLGETNPLWDNREEYKTIRKGKVSEQTLRQQYGLSAERFGHSDYEIQEPVQEAVANLLKAEDELMELKPETVNKKLSEAGFPAETTATMVNELKLKVFHSDLKGPVPEGWELSQLTFEQLTEILAPKPLPARLHEFGWKPYGLNRARMEEIYLRKEHHPRSEKGLRMRALGGQDALKAFDSLNEFAWETGFKLEPSTGKTWEDDLAALEAADQLLIGLSRDYKGQGIQEAAGGKTKLQKRIFELVQEFTYFKWEFDCAGGDKALAAIAECQKLFGEETLPTDLTSLFTKYESISKAKIWLRYQREKLSPEEDETVKGNLEECLRTVAEICRLKIEKELKEFKEFEEFGGQKGFDCSFDILFYTGGRHEPDFEDSLSSKIAQCRAARAALEKYALSKSDKVKSIAASKEPLHKKLELIQAAEQAEAAEQNKEET